MKFINPDAVDDYGRKLCQYVEGEIPCHYDENHHVHMPHAFYWPATTPNLTAKNLYRSTWRFIKYCHRVRLVASFVFGIILVVAVDGWAAFGAFAAFFVTVLAAMLEGARDIRLPGRMIGKGYKFTFDCPQPACDFWMGCDDQNTYNVVTQGHVNDHAEGE